jgi:glycosyltransferase involved in cell wall biosynthesis
MKKSLKIGIDGRALQGNRAGIGRYIFELCKELDSLMPNASFYIYSQNVIDMPVNSSRWISRVDDFPFNKFLKSVVWLKLRCGSLCRDDDLDLFWGASTFFPKLAASVKKVTTVYDLNHIVVPNTMGKYTYWSYKMFFAKDVKKANVVTVISKGTSRRLSEQLGIRSDAVIYPSISNIYKYQSTADIQNTLREYRIKQPYILAVGTWEPRKNLELLIETFINMKKDKLLPNYQLVLAGGKGWKDARLLSLIKTDTQNYVAPLGYVAELDLPKLYAGSDAFVFPSIYEGFGMPVLEALACGARVVTTDIPELHEAGGASSTFIKPTACGIREGIVIALSKSAGSNNDIFLTSWRDGAEKLSNIFNEICNYD